MMKKAIIAKLKKTFFEAKVENYGTVFPFFKVHHRSNYPEAHFWIAPGLPPIQEWLSHR